MPQVGKRQFAYTKEGEQEAEAYAAETGEEVIQKDSYGYARGGMATPVSHKAFEELKSITDEDGIDIGKYLNSKAFSEWLSQDYKSSDDKQIKAIYKRIMDSYDNPEEGQEIGSKFLNIIATNKPNNPWGEKDQFGYGVTRG